MSHTITIDINAVEQLINALRPKDRIQILKDIEKTLWKSQIHTVVNKMRKYTKEKGITDKEIDIICKDVRRKHYDKN